MKPNRKASKGAPAQPRFRESLDPAAAAREHGDLPLDVLRAAGILNATGAASADANRKIKQIKHFIQLIRPALDDVFSRHAEPVLVDAGAGRSALSLVIHRMWVERHGRGSTWAVEARPELCDRVETARAALGMQRFHVVRSSIDAAELPERVHFVLALHACDTATDDALALALRRGADHVACVPCCQAEVARLLASARSTSPASQLWAHAWHRREFGAHFTNVVRAMTLQAYGYQVTVTELAGWEHTPKNELILGRRVARFHRGAIEARRRLLEEIPVEPAIVRLAPGPEPVAQSSGCDDREPSHSTSSEAGGTSSETEA